MPVKHRLILKISGAALRDKNGSNILSCEKLNGLAEQIKVLSKSHQIGVVVGGGNIWRGGTSDHNCYREERAHYMGMIATVINSVALGEVLLKHQVPTEVISLLPCPTVVKNYTPALANKLFKQNKVVILAGGTGKPFFSTDTGATKTATELKCNLILMAKDGVDGVYSADPKINKQAKHYDHLTFDEAIKQRLKVMDQSALAMCKKNKIDILVFDIERPNAIIKALSGEIPHTLVSNK